MADSLASRIRRGWNAFTDSGLSSGDNHLGYSYGMRQDRGRGTMVGAQTTLGAVRNRISMDAADNEIRHIRVNENRNFVEDIYSSLNECLTIAPNLDQTAKPFKQDAILSMFDWGVIAIVPVDTVGDPYSTSSYDIRSLRVGQITQWFPAHVRVRLYDERDGRYKEVIVEKRIAAIVENPMYEIMNAPNSTYQRLLRKLSLLDTADEKLGNGKLDLLIQLPYAIKTETRRLEADRRLGQIESQLRDSTYGIAYIDGTEKVTQLNRPVENTLLDQIKYLTEELFGQLGVTAGVMDGSADDKTMRNYFSRTVDPLIDAITESMARTFLTKTARSQGQTIRHFRDPFAAITLPELAELTDKLTRNEVASSNDMRSMVGWRPSADPAANELRNKNINQNPGAEADPSGQAPTI